MKKLILLFTLTLFLFNCSDDDDNNINVNDRLTITFDTETVTTIEGTSDNGFTVIDLIVNVSGAVISEDLVVELTIGENSTFERSDFIIDNFVCFIVPVGDYRTEQSISIPVSIVQDSQFEADDIIEFVINNPEDNFDIGSFNTTTIIVEDDDEFVLLGSKYVITNFLIDSSIDTNNDGVFSNDVIEALPECQRLPLLEFGCRFLDDFAFNVTLTFVLLRVDDDGNGSLAQANPCNLNQIGGQIAISYEQEGDLIRFTRNSLEFTGLISEDRRTITINLSGDSLPISIDPNNGFFRGNEILREDNTIEEYTGDVTLIYTLQ